MAATDMPISFFSTGSLEDPLQEAGEGRWRVGNVAFDLKGLEHLHCQIVAVFAERPAPFKDESIGSSGGDSRMMNLGRQTRAKREAEAAAKAERKAAKKKR